MTHAVNTIVPRAHSQRVSGWQRPALAVVFATSSAFAHSFLVDAAPSSKEHVIGSPKP
jgi:methionine-rich copper-binding protein CopC